MKNLNANEVKQIAKELKIKDWWNKKREVLVAEIATVKGWTNHTPANIEFLLAGGTVTELPPAGNIPVKPQKETSAMKAVEKAPRKRPAKKADKKVTTKKVTAKKEPKNDNMVTLSQILTEMGVEGRIARRKLRNSEIKKPGSTWEWEKGHADIARVQELLK